jgi:hypothetical protein
MAIPIPNCIVTNLRTGMTHYATSDHEGEIFSKQTWCGKPIHEDYSLVTKFINQLTPKCKVCDSKERSLRGSSEHWLHVQPTNPW